jgi:hypothetical protein
MNHGHYAFRAQYDEPWGEQQDRAAEYRAEQSRQALLAAAVAFGYRIEHGTDLADPELHGKWWWTLSQPGWMECEVSHDEWATQREAEDAMILAHCNELMEA